MQNYSFEFDRNSTIGLIFIFSRKVLADSNNILTSLYETPAY